MAAYWIGEHRVTERFVFGTMLVRIDEDLAHLRAQPIEHVTHHRRAAQRNETLVDAAHPPALSAGEHEARDTRLRHWHESAARR